MGTTEITFDADTVNVSTISGTSADMRVTADVDVQTVLENFEAAEVLEHISRDDFLEAIGEEYVHVYFCIDADK
ncbi:hypothetical protein [Pseudomonas arsenicoxydans]|uniref:Uncharacterized protein n=1 Tax=Pseudomonas arsenicoxydans TaxID=702115 RepID=A0A502HRQ1_9PSED|nr:hypothetical protein [Pseudomonas arsenicoxydans]TPG76334.1 hypothetical protein EAH78_18400 [Pseudomonas arsenicoxydans]